MLLEKGSTVRHLSWLRITVAGRPPSLPGVNDSVGMYVNTLPVRVRLTETEPAAAAVRELQTRQQQRAPFEHHALADVQRQSSVPMNRRLFDSILVSHSFPSTFDPRGELDLTVEGLRCGDDLTPIQEAMVRCHGSQCGFCTPGIATRAAHLDLRVRVPGAISRRPTRGSHRRRG